MVPCQPKAFMRLSMKSGPAPNIGQQSASVQVARLKQRVIKGEVPLL